MGDVVLLRCPRAPRLLGNGVATGRDWGAVCRSGLWEVRVSPFPRRWTAKALFARGRRAMSLWRGGGGGGGWGGAAGGPGGGVCGGGPPGQVAGGGGPAFGGGAAGCG